MHTKRVHLACPIHGSSPHKCTQYWADVKSGTAKGMPASDRRRLIGAIERERIAQAEAERIRLT